MSEDRQLFEVAVSDDMGDFNVENPYAVPQYFYFRNDDELTVFIKQMVVDHHKIVMVYLKEADKCLTLNG